LKNIAIGAQRAPIGIAANDDRTKRYSRDNFFAKVPPKKTVVGLYRLEF
jgi:hypothetical protein